MRTLEWMAMVLCAVGVSAAMAAEPPLYEEVEGVVVMEVESGLLARQHAWKGETAMEGYTGKGYLTWGGPDLLKQPGSGMIAFRFRIPADGKYHLRLRNRHDFEDATEQNDCYTRVDDGKWTKTFSPVRGQWTWRTHHEHNHSEKPPASYDLKAGEHTLLLAGRSKGFSIDRIHLIRDGVKGGENEKLPETLASAKPGKRAKPKPDAATPQAQPQGDAQAGGNDYPVRPARAKVEGTRKAWQPVTLAYEGPDLSEDGLPNPFTDFRMAATFRQGEQTLVVPGYYAADGRSADTSATTGGVWRVHFLPPNEGEWEVTVSFRHGEGVALGEPGAGRPAAFDGSAETLRIAAPDRKAEGFYGKGVLRYVGKRYLQFPGTGEWFLKGGADSPENLLGYADFDGTSDTKGNFLHRYEPHVRDWRSGDPTWGRDAKGKGLIGAINYLASKGMNSVYFIPYNLDGGDGGDTWPWTDPKVRDRFDCSKLDQWGIVFAHMQSRGVAMHVILQETENDQAMDGGDLGPVRKLYLREMIARFAHNPAIVWNLGEENTNTLAQRKAIAQYLRDLDPYDHPIVLHTYPGQQESVYRPLLGFDALEGPSLQTGAKNVHAETIKWIDASSQTGRPWVVCSDEIGPADVGVKPDADDPTRDEVRRYVLWGNLLAGGGGCEWYFGYKYAHNDLNCEDWRSRDALWDQTAVALRFFHENLPFPEMQHADDLTSTPDAWCLAKPGEVYAIYLPGGQTTKLTAPPGRYELNWFNPRIGGKLQAGGALTVAEGKPLDLPAPPDQQDWVALVRRSRER